MMMHSVASPCIIHAADVNYVQNQPWSAMPKCSSGRGVLSSYGNFCYWSYGCFFSSNVLFTIQSCAIERPLTSEVVWCLQKKTKKMFMIANLNGGYKKYRFRRKSHRMQGLWTLMPHSASLCAMECKSHVSKSWTSFPAILVRNDLKLRNSIGGHATSSIMCLNVHQMCRPRCADRVTS